MKKNMNESIDVKVNTPYSLGRYYTTLINQMDFKIKMSSRLADYMWLSRGLKFFNRWLMKQKEFLRHSLAMETSVTTQLGH